MRAGAPRRHQIRLQLLVEATLAAVLLTVGAVALLNGPAAAAPGPVVVGAVPVVLAQPADPFLGKIAPAADADVAGMYAPQVTWPLVAIHATLLPSGHVVTYGSPLGQAQQGGLAYDDWNPARGTGPGGHEQTPSMHAYDSFCNALALLPDGRVLMVGGNSTTTSMVYDPTTGEQTMGATLNRQRWYASLLRLPDDRMLVLGGADYYNTDAYVTPDDNTGVATAPEIGDGTGEWSVLTGADSSLAFGAKDNRWWYPRAFVDPAGTVFGVSYDQMWRLDPSGVGSVQSLGTLADPIGVSGSSVMYAPGRILFAGGGQRFNATAEVATNASTIVDLNGDAPVVTTAPAMQHARNWLNLTVLANGEVLANGGTRVGTEAGAANSVYQAEIWNPTTGQWRLAATAQRIRTYHSTSLLLPGGSVLTGGGGLPGPENNFNAELFYPPHLFTRGTDGAVAWAARPQIKTISGTIARGSTITLGMNDARPIASASLTSLGSVTHSYNTDQRQVPLTLTQQNQSLSVTLPASHNTLPPGSYLMQAVDTNGVPTPSQIITVNADGSPGTVTIYEADQATGGGQTGNTTEPGIVPLTAGTAVGLEATNLYGFRARHANYRGRIDPIGGASDATAKADSSFTVRRGLADPACVSFESVNLPGYFFRHQAYAIYLRQNDGTALFAADATFCARTGLSGQYTSLESYNFPGRYLRHRNQLLYIDVFDGTDLARKDMTFAVRPALQPPAGYHITGVQSSRCLDVNNGALTNLTRAVLWDCSTSQVSQVWQYTAGKEIAIAGNRCLDTNGMGTTKGTAIIIYDCNGQTNQQWNVNPDGTITGVGSGLCLDAAGRQTANGTRIILWTCNGQTNQQWTLT